MTFGEKLQELRRKAGMSQDALAERLEVSRQAVSKWERDEAMPETEKVVRIAKLFGVSLDELLLDQPGKAAAQLPQNSAYADMKRTVKRHGYKAGYLLVVLGILNCIVSLLMWQIWPQIGTSMLRTEPESEFLNPYAGKSYTIIVGGEEQVITDIPEFMIEHAMEKQGLNHAGDSVDAVFENALRAQSGLFLIGLIPGGILIVAGILIVVKGKKLAESQVER